MSAIKDITLKYMRFTSTSRALAAMTVISIVGIAIGVATLTMTLSVASGFGKEYQRAILDFNAHVVLLSTQEIRDSQKVLERLGKFNASEEDKDNWKDASLLIALLKPVEMLWIRLNQFYLDLQFLYSGPSWLIRLMNKSSPAVVSQYLYLKGWYPRWLVNKIVQILKLSQKGIVGVNPFIYREGLLIYKGQIRGVVVKGVDPAGAKAVSNMKISLLPPPGSGGSDEPAPIILGLRLAGDMGIKAGERVRLMLPEHWQEKSAKGFEEFRVISTFETGMYDFDSQFILLNLKTAQKIFNAPDTVSGVEIKLDDWKKSPLFATRIGKEFSYPLYATHWQELNRSLFEAVKLERLMFIIIMGALVVVAAFNIIGTVMLRILYKTSDISILRALGMDIKNIEKIFVMQGMIVGFIGTALGMAVALILIWSITKFEWVTIPPEIYLLPTLPVCISWTAGVMIAAFSLMVCWLTSVVASKKVLELPIVRGLHRP